MLDIVTAGLGMARGDQEIRGLQREWAMEGEQRKWKNVIKVEGRKNYRKQRNFLTRNTEKGTQEYLDIIEEGKWNCNEHNITV